MTLRKNSRDRTQFEFTGDEVVSESFKSRRDVTKIPRSVVSRLFGWQDPRLLREGAQIGKEPRKRMGMRLRFKLSRNYSYLQNIWCGYKNFQFQMGFAKISIAHPIPVQFA